MRTVQEKNVSFFVLFHFHFINNVLDSYDVPLPLSLANAGWGWFVNIPFTVGTAGMLQKMAQESLGRQVSLVFFF
jgi:hypothetical protein